MRDVARSGGLFVLLFAGGLALGGGVLAGAFADADRVFTDHFADGGNRVRDIAASYLLALAGLAFAWFAHALSRDTGERRVPLLLAGSFATGGMVLAAVAWATVPMSLWFGSIYGDPGLQEGQAVLPQFGYVALMMGAMLPGAAFMVLAARTPGLLPRWLAIASYPVAVLVAFAAVLFMPLFLFLGWVGAVAATRRRST